jgi:hypothetical protein
MLITNGTITQSGMRRRTIQKQVSFGPVSLRIATIVILATAGLFALMQSTASATKAYDLTTQERMINEKQKDIEITNAEVARLRALSNNNVITGQDGASPAPSPSPTPKLEAPDKINALPSQSTTVSFR